MEHYRNANGMQRVSFLLLLSNYLISGREKLIQRLLKGNKGIVTHLNTSDLKQALLSVSKSIFCY